MIQPKQRSVCSRCVMDTTDPEIWFDENGVCKHCHAYDRKIAALPAADPQALPALAAGIRAAGRGRAYDCVIGVSGGVDSSYVAYLVRRLGLRALAVHFDNGWDLELAVHNIATLLNQLGIDLYTHVVDWEQFRDLQLAFLRASTPDSEIPTDHAITALLYQIARKFRVRYVISGVNARTESHMPRAWSQGYYDWSYLRRVHQEFGGGRSLSTYPHMSLPEFVRYRMFSRWVDILNYTDYNKTAAMETLSREMGWRCYGQKHHESLYTRFYQTCLLPRKFGFDKRKAHLSSLICAGEITREGALAELNQPPVAPEIAINDLDYVTKKLAITPAEMRRILEAPGRRYEEFTRYPRWLRERKFRIVRIAVRLLAQQFSFRSARPVSAPEPVAEAKEEAAVRQA